MWRQKTSIVFSPMFKLACAMAISSGVWSFPLIISSSRKDQSRTTMSLCTTTFENGWHHAMQHCLGTNHHLTRCDATPQPTGTNLVEEVYEKMPLPERGFHQGHAIFGVLLGENMIESYDVYRRLDGSIDQNIIVAHVKLGNRIDGHPGVVHGGILSLIFDDVLGYGFEALGIKMAFTANLSVDYRAPVPAGTMIRVQAQLEHREGRKLFWRAQMTSMDRETLFAECSCLYIIPRSHAQESIQ